jgi:site-specific DNA-methyltransferase (cytosine-N4-specific)
MLLNFKPITTQTTMHPIPDLQIENQRVYFSSSEHMEAIEDESIPLIITSPPYWNVRDYGEDQIGFNQSYEEYITSLNRVWAECIRVLQPNGKFAINVQPLPIAATKSGYNRRVIRDIMFDIEKFMLKNDLFLSGMIYWNKAPYINNVSWGSYPKPTNIATNTSFEQIYTFVKRGKTRKVDKVLLAKSILSKDEWRHWAVSCIWDDISPVIKINQKKENLFGHGAPFPEDIPYRLIRMHTAEGETVLDPFLGSGTTLKVARLTNRKGIGYELNPDYRDRIHARITEDWIPPVVDPLYKTLSSAELTLLIATSIQETKTQILNSNSAQTADLDAKISKAVLSQLRRKKILSPANIKRIKNQLNERLDQESIE